VADAGARGEGSVGQRAAAWKPTAWRPARGHGAGLGAEASTQRVEVSVGGQLGDGRHEKIEREMKPLV
jgi:hypothetical protein